MDRLRLLGHWTGELRYVGPDWEGTELEGACEPLELEIREDGEMLVVAYRERDAPVVVTALEFDAEEDDATFYVPAAHPTGRPAAARFRGKLSEAEERFEGEWEIGVLVPEMGENFLDAISIGTWSLSKCRRLADRGAGAQRR